MAVLTINAVTLDLGAEPTRRAIEIGENSRAFDGSLRKHRQALKRAYELETGWLSASEARAWEGLINGESQHWGFETSLYSGSGLGPSASSGATQQTSTPKFGTGRLQLAATTGTITYPAVLGSTWTIGGWRSTNSGTTWTHYLIRSDGAKWVNGTRSDATSTPWFTVSSGSFVISNVTGSAVHFDDCYCMPFLVPEAWGPMLGAATTVFGDSPKLTVGGDLVLLAPITAICTAMQSKQSTGVLSSTFEVVHALTFTLEEA